MSKLTDFFTELNQDVKLQQAYKKDPRGVMQQYGLTDEEAEAVMSGDMSKVQSLSGDKNMKLFMLIANHSE
ncbi:hypothetical protein G3R49_05300 [Shewanella sp. WXL01]|uniref:Extradiol ring-cleavage dioxygenase LigAB LigA subunit domain-containing protein n=1 Tax=Shewanella maritima TaxID=2520507 RepID=A0A411PER6_9GAMM|nr:MULTISPECIES: hypothetical protein [Shewanella]NKF49987.1 hypothetical protein [Shewanella sp. WXL01]QBF81952.1 hypothetical protein EXU30_03990 [Shewanella maritima]